MLNDFCFGSLAADKHIFDICPSSNSAYLMLNLPKRIQKEQSVVSWMIIKYCHAHHKLENASVCKDCSELRNYALQRLERCPFADQKPFCSKCPIHCYNKEMRANIRFVMRYAGPRMLFSHPIMSLGHFLSRYRKFDYPRQSEAFSKGKRS